MNPQLSLGRIGLAIFFVLSGYLVWQSWQRSGRVRSYLEKRALRIIPGLIVVALIGAFLVGPILTTLSLGDYLANPETWTYPIKTSALLTLEGTLPGVLENRPYPDNQINAPLWTLPIEALAYLLLLPLALIIKRQINKDPSNKRGLAAPLLFLAPTALVGIAYYSLATSSESFSIIYQQIPWLLLLFFLGISLNGLPRLPDRYFYLSLILLPLLLTQIGPLILALLIGLLILSLGQKRTALGKKLRAKVGDISYGIYIFSFLVQQLLVFFWPGIGPWTLFLFALLGTIPLAILSWRYIEKPALGLKKKIGESG